MKTGLTILEIASLVGASCLDRNPLPHTRHLTRAWAGDVLADALAFAPAGGLLITTRAQRAAVAVAAQAGLSAILFTSGRLPDEETLAAASREAITVWSSSRETFDVAGVLAREGISGGRRE